jgi:outer membrane lipoprotein SlyB
MKRLQKFTAASVIALSLSGVATAGTITGSKAGTITGSKSGTITGSKSGTITGSKSGTITGSSAGTITGSRTETQEDIFTTVLRVVMNLYW